MAAGVARIGLAFVGTTVVQVLAARWIDPPLTLTMVQRSVEHAAAGRGLAWPAHVSTSLTEAGPTVPRAVVASEDARFFLHHGFDAAAICAAVRSNAEGGPVRGASTLTQQVAKNVFLWQHRDWVRKGLEAWYTVLLELLLPKERILELYLDVAETGPMVFGVEAGARHHFGRSARALTANQAGRLAGVLPDPRRRSVEGHAAADRAAFVERYPAPFPGDASFERVRAAVEAEGGWRACLR